MKKSPFAILVFITIISLLASCKQDSNTEVAQDGTLHIRLQEDPQKLHPYVYPGTTAREIYQYIFPQLADFDPITLDLIPVLIKEVPEEIAITEGPNKGGVKFQIEYRDEAKWDDGTDITGNDYLYSIKSAKHPMVKAGGYRSHLQFVSEVNVDANNPKKFEVIFSKDYLLAKETALTIETYPAHIYDPNGLLTNISLDDISNEETITAIMEKDSSINQWVENMNGITYARNTVNSGGPYKLSEWVTDEYIVLERKDNFWGSESTNPFLQAGPKRIIFDIIPDETTALTQMRENGVDLIANISGAAYKTLQEQKEYQLFTPQLTKYYMIAMNNERAELSDKNVRQALSHLVDVNNIMNVIDYGNGTRTVGPIHPGKSYYNDDLTPTNYNPARAKKILAEAGWKDTNNNGTIDKNIDGSLTELELDMYISGGKLGEQIALLMQSATADADIKINIIKKTGKEYSTEHVKKRNYDLTPMMVRQDLVLDDPYARWHSDHIKDGGRNVYGFDNEEIDQITKEIQTISDPTKRNKLYKRVQEIIHEETPVIFLYAPNERIAVSNKWNATSTVRRPGYLANTFTLK